MSVTIDILLPVRDAESTLTETLSALQAQRYVRFRCLLLDDGSRDASSDLMARCAAADDRFTVVTLPRVGLQRALNAGLGRVRSPLVARMDADDVPSPDWLSATRQTLESESLDVAGCRFEVFKSDGGAIGTGMRRYAGWANGLLSPEDHYRERYVESPVAHSSILARRAIFATGYDESRPYLEDYDLWLRRLNEGARFGKVPRVLLRVRDDAERTSRQATDYRDRLRALKIFHLTNDLLARHTRVVVWGAGRVGKRWLRDLPGVGCPVVAAVDLHPRKIGKRIHGASVILPDALPPLLSQPGTICLVAVGAAGARADIRDRADKLGLHEGRDFVFVA